MRKLPPDAFDYYFSLGPGRSYEAVAKHYGVAKRTVTSLAKRGNWQGRLRDIEAKARERSDERHAAVKAEAKEQRLKALRILLGKSIQKLAHNEINSTADAIRGLGTAVRELRAEYAESPETADTSVEEIIKREYRNWMTSSGDDYDDLTDTETTDDAGDPEPGEKGS
jgi:transposase-like protein